MKSISILIVEDEAIVAKSIERQLLSHGYSVIGSVTTGHDALGLAARSRPDLILLDIRLKGTMDGIEVARIIRDWFRIPIIFITAFADKATIERARDTGPMGYLTKPFGMKELHATITSALSCIERENADTELSPSIDARHPEVLDKAPVAMAAVDPDKKIILVNTAFETLTGYSRTDIAGVTNLSFLIETRDKEKIFNYLRIIPINPPVAPTEINVQLITATSREIPVTLLFEHIGESSLMVISFMTVPSGH